MDMKKTPEPSPARARWTDTPAYVTVHKRNLKERGHASNYDCYYSNPRRPHPADQWAYLGDDPDEFFHKDGPYSRDPSHYVAMCRRHHKRHDQVVNKILDCGCAARQHMRTGCSGSEILRAKPGGVGDVFGGP